MNETTRKTLEQTVEECGRYPIEAFEFVRAGLNHTVQQVHGEAVVESGQKQAHVSGQQLCEGLRDFALHRYGMMARAVMHHWKITKTGDFGRIVFAMVEAKLMQKTEEDELVDFSDVYEFNKAFEPPVRPSVRGKPTFKM